MKKKLSFLLFLAIFTPNLHSIGAMAKTIGMAARRVSTVARATQIARPKIPSRISTTQATPKSTNPFLKRMAIGAGLVSSVAISQNYLEEKFHQKLRNIEKDFTEDDTVFSIKETNPELYQNLKKAYNKAIGYNANIRFHSSPLNGYQAGVIKYSTRSKAVVLISQELLDDIPLVMLEVIIGHEAIHVKERHIAIENIFSHADILALAMILKSPFKTVKSCTAKLTKVQAKVLVRKLLIQSSKRIPLVMAIYLIKKPYFLVLSRYLEKRADTGAAKALGPMGSIGLSAYFTVLKDLNPKGANLTLQEKLTSSTHPGYSERIKYLDKLTKKLVKLERQAS